MTPPTVAAPSSSPTARAHAIAATHRMVHILIVTHANLEHGRLLPKMNGNLVVAADFPYSLDKTLL